MGLNGFMNSVTLCGTVFKPPRLHKFDDEKSVVTFTLLVKGYPNTSTFITVKAWNKQAEYVAKSVSQGQQVLVQGRLNTNSYVDNKTGEKKYMTEVVANEINFAIPHPSNAEYGQDDRRKYGEEPRQSNNDGGPGSQPNDDDTPF